MNWLPRSRVILFIFINLILLFFVFQFSLLYPFTITSRALPSISVPRSTNNGTASYLTIHKSCCSDKTMIPRIAYFISGSNGDGETVKRILQAVYHPNNVYIVHLDRTASLDELNELFIYINNHVVFLTVGNVKMIGKPNVVSENGPTKVANVLHAAAILLRTGGKWDWFINLDAFSYPLVTQDDLLYVLSKMPRHLNFIDHTRWFDLFHEESKSEIMVSDRALYTPESGITILSEKREMPDFRTYSGSSLMALSHSFVDYCIGSWDNFPRTLLMYQANSISPAETYFQTLICNSLEFSQTSVNTDLHCTVRDRLYNPRYIDYHDWRSMTESNAPFARKFDDSSSHDVLDSIDGRILSRGQGMLLPGGWCAGTNRSDRCLTVGDVTKLQHGRGVARLQRFFDHQCKKPVIIHNGSVSSAQCNKHVRAHDGL